MLYGPDFFRIINTWRYEEIRIEQIQKVRRFTESFLE